MYKILTTTLLSTLVSTALFAADTIATNMQEDSTEEIAKKDKTSLDGFFTTYELGASKITLGDIDHKAIYFASKGGYTLDNGFTLYTVGESNYYRLLGDINDIGLGALGLSYDLPYTANKLTIGAAAGFGMSVNYNRVFNDFRKSFDFGFAYRADIAYNINKSWALDISYSKFDFNTNATQLEDTKPEILSASIVYKFDMASLLD